MIEKMTKYSVVLRSGDQESFLAKLQELGLVDITRSRKPVSEASLKALSEIEHIKGLVDGLKKVEIPDGTVARDLDGDIVLRTGELLKQYSGNIETISALEKERNRIAAWGPYDTSLVGELSDAGAPLHFHVLSKKSFKDEWAEDYALSVVAEVKGNVRFVVAGEDGLPGEIPAPRTDLGSIEGEISEAEKNCAEVLSELAGARNRIAELEALRSEGSSRLDLILADESAVPAVENTLVILEGYAPVGSDAPVTDFLESSGVVYLKEEATVEDNPPIAFRNNRFVRMFETLTDMYGRPAYDGFDPTPYISIFFLLFFAFCMGDAGYGLVLVLIGLLLRKSAKDLAPLVVTLGLGTVVIGFLFHTFFSMDISTWRIFAPIKGMFLPSQIAGNDATMVLSLAIGVLHICLAMVVKTIHETRTKGFYASLGTWGWTLLVVGGVIVAAFALAGVLDAVLTKWIVIVLGLVSALGIFVFNDPKRNKLANIGMGLWDTYNMVTGLVGDVLSYIRLYALGLAGAMLGKAFNDMGMMILGDTPNIGKWLAFLLLVIFGHTLNIAMCALGAFVHPLRLNFLEFFKNAGYEASGRNFNPLKKSLNKQ